MIIDTTCSIMERKMKEAPECLSFSIMERKMKEAPECLSFDFVLKSNVELATAGSHVTFDDFTNTFTWTSCGTDLEFSMLEYDSA